MKKLVRSDQLKIKILETLSDRKSYTYYALSKKLGTGYETLAPNCHFLEALEFIEITKITKEESASARAYYSVKITGKGMEFIRGYGKDD